VCVVSGITSRRRFSLLASRRMASRFYFYPRSICLSCTSVSVSMHHAVFYFSIQNPRHAEEPGAGGVAPIRWGPRELRFMLEELGQFVWDCLHRKRPICAAAFAFL
jgi:hypothetical protein